MSKNGLLKSGLTRNDCRLFTYYSDNNNNMDYDLCTIYLGRVWLPGNTDIFFILASVQSYVITSITTSGRSASCGATLFLLMSDCLSSFFFMFVISISPPLGRGDIRASKLGLVLGDSCM